MSAPHNPGSALNLRRFKRSAGFAWAGVAYTWQSQPNFKIEVLCGALACALALLLRAPLGPVLLCCALVLSLELVNTALEALTDLVAPDVHPLAKIAKDAAAGAVLLASLFSVGVALAVLGPPLVHMLAP